MASTLIFLFTFCVFISVINQRDEQNFCFTISLFHASTCFEHYVLIIRRSELHYTSSDPVGCRLVHRCATDDEPTGCDDTRDCIIQV